MKTISLNANTVDKKWVVIDASDKVLGRVATKVAAIIRGKTKPTFTPHVDCGDNVIVINAEKVTLSGNKWEAKEYIRHSGYPGGQKSIRAIEMLKKHPERLVEKAVKGMLPKNKLGSKLYTNLDVVVGIQHKHEAQKPRRINLQDIK